MGIKIIINEIKPKKCFIRAMQSGLYWWMAGFLSIQTFMAEAEKLPGIISFHEHLSISKRGMRLQHWTFFKLLMMHQLCSQIISDFCIIRN
jgi:hypothetical protein